MAEVDAVDRRATVRVYSWVDIAQPVRRAEATDAAAILARLHALAIPDERPMDAWFRDAVAGDRWQEILAATRTSRRCLGAGPGASRARTRRGGALIAAGRHEPRITCHLDFNPENVLADTQGEPVVVDWENSGPAAAEQELASVLAEFVPDPAGSAGFLRAYEEAGGPARLRDASSFAMCLAFQSELTAWYAERALDPKVTEEDQRPGGPLDRRHRRQRVHRRSDRGLAGHGGRILAKNDTFTLG